MRSPPQLPAASAKPGDGPALTRRPARRARLSLTLLLTAALPAAPLSPPTPAASYMVSAAPDRRDHSMLATALHTLAAQRGGVTDLYVVGFAGDASEEVFRNETLYLQRLFGQRFGATGRIVTLVNDVGNSGDHRYAPQASYDNLYATLTAVGRKMDRDEDLLLLFLTSHGGEDSSLYVHPGENEDEQDADWITPEDLRQALDASGIRHRVIVVSACYSGGFIPVLKTPDTMIITAARADRASFGCGNTTEITYFGRAWLVDGLNRSSDFEQAYWFAAGAIDARERADGEIPSLPQIWRGGRIGAVLAHWQAGLQPGPILPYRAASDAN